MRLSYSGDQLGLGTARLVISRELRDFGFWPTLYDLSFRGLKRVVTCEIWKAVISETAQPEFASIPEGCEARLLNASAMMRHIGSDSDLSEKVVQHAIEKGDECLAVFQGDRLATYAWYSTRPTDIDHELQLRFRSDYVYLYKAFTHPDFRGRRLHAIATTLAISEYRTRGYQGIVSAISSHNLSSLRAFYRMGFHDLGKVYGVKAGRQYFLHHDRGCRDFDFVISPKPAVTVPKTSQLEAA